MEIKGIAHITFTVSDFEKALPFYTTFFAEIGLKEMIVADGYYYCVGRRIGLGIQHASPDLTDNSFNQGRAGLHHYCLSMNTREDVNSLTEVIRDAGGKIIREPAPQDHWVPGMYSVLFEDPEGLRIEANHITPKQG
ncbi:MAG: VOC family protein [Parvibaculaceae bacterium]|nr:VOC family protein [Parvibaculaceae bacterium]